MHLSGTGRKVAILLPRCARRAGVKRRAGPADPPRVSDAFVQAWTSSHTILAICFGISVYVAALHLTLARRGHTANLWVALWALATATIQLGRFAQIYAEEPADAFAAADLALASFPVLIGSLAWLVRSLAGRPVSRPQAFVFAAVTLVFAALALATPLFMGDVPIPKLDPFGRPIWGREAGPGMPLVGVAIVAAALAMMREGRTLEPYDRRVLWLSLAVYACGALASWLHVYAASSVPLIAGFGPAVTAVGLSHLVVGYERRLARAQAQLGMQELAASEARLRELVEHAPVGIVSCDAAGQVHTVNPRMWQILGAPEGARPAAFGNAILYAPSRGSGGPELVRRALDTGETVSGEARLVSAWGRAMELRVVVSPLRGANGEVTGALMLLEDVGERNALEQRLRLAQKMEAIGQLAAGIAHEINTPMAYVRSNLRALHHDWAALREEIRKDPDSEATGELVAGAEQLIGESLEGVERTIAIARDMREFAHTASAAREPTDLDRELETCVRLASTQRPGVTITERYGEGPQLSASASQLRQVFLNLLVNALQAVSENGHITVTSACEPGFAVVCVMDDGSGIAKELQHRLFEPFFTTKPADQGTGLGLYISYQIVRAHGGEIRVESTPGQGSRFEVRLPLERS